jgi:hypothetical protein
LKRVYSTVSPLTDEEIGSTDNIGWDGFRGTTKTTNSGVDLTIERRSPPLYAYYGYAKGKCHERDRAPLIKAIPEGWIWTSKVKHDLYQWIRLSCSFSMTCIPYDWLPDEFKGLTPTPNPRIYGSDVTWRRVIQPAGSGYFIVGDAAIVVDPASSHGVLRALMSGIMAASKILHILNNKTAAIAVASVSLFKACFTGKRNTLVPCS